MNHGVPARRAAPPQLSCPFQLSPGQRLPPRPLTFFPEGGNRAVGEWEMTPPKAERTVLLGVALMVEVVWS